MQPHLESYSDRLSDNKIFLVCTQRGISPVGRFIERLDERTLSETATLFDSVERNGPPRTVSKFRHLSGSVFEFKVHRARAVRYLGFRVVGGWAIAVAEDKPKPTALRRSIALVQAVRDRMEVD